MNELTEQSVFDTVVKHFKTQQVRAVDLDGACLYRGPNGTSCAVGCLIPDDKYRPEFEGQSIYGLKSDERLPEELVPFATSKNNSASLLDQLQHIHDEAKKGLLTAEVALKLRTVAETFGLSDAEVTWGEFSEIV